MTRTTTKRAKNGEATGKRIVWKDARTLLPSPENAILYRERTTNDSDFARLVDSIRKDGVQAPLLVSQDSYIVSGHQRQHCAIVAERFLVPVIYLNLFRSDHTSDEWLAILREHNTGREKLFDELVREKLVDIDPDKVIVQIENDRVERSESRVELIDLGTRTMKRDGIDKVKFGMVDAIFKVLRDLKEYLPVSLRAVHYRLLVEEFFRNNRTKLRYENNLESYKDLSKLLTKLRVNKEVPWAWICDETRPLSKWQCWKNAAEFIGEQCDDLFRGYARDLLQSQPLHIEIVAEKLTVKNFINKIASRYRMPVVIMRGNSGIDARHQMVQRFEKSGKNNLYLICIGDCDPDGDSIVESTLCSLRDDFGVTNVTGTRVAMTHEQAEHLHLPKMLKAKEKSSNYASFVKKHGRTDCYECEAVAPEVLQGWTDNAIRGVIDIEAYNHEVDRQKQEAQEILARRKAVLQVLRSGSGD